jgi:hypothetical protein
MPRTARASDSLFLRLYPDIPPSPGGHLSPPASGEALAAADRGFLLQLQRQALEYFVDNQAANGLMLDRQSNHGPRRAHGLCSTAATGMGFIALALACAAPHRLLGARCATQRIRAGLETVLHALPHSEGVVPHFIDSLSGEIRGVDHHSTVETAWVAAGALWAAAFLGDGELQELAGRLYDRIHWHYWTAPEDPAANGLLRHGADRDGRLLACCWDRVNGETAFMYVLGAGAAEGRALTAASWGALRPFYGTVAGLRFNNADLGLFVFQYGLDLLDLHRWRAPGAVDLPAEARLATEANHRACRERATDFATFRRFWGLSAGDGPGDPPAPDGYRSYAPAGPMDGTAHLTATVASVAHRPAEVLDNLYQAQHETGLAVRGRYGFSNVNLDRAWVGRDTVGIDAGAAVLALDNYLMGDRVRAQFHNLPCVRRGLERLAFTPAAQPARAEPLPELAALVHRAS